MSAPTFIALGNATRDAQLRKSREGDTQFATFTIAVNREQQNTAFYPVIVFGPTAEFAAKTIKKGDKVLVEGTINQRSYRSREREPRIEIQVQAEQWRKL